MDEDLIEGVDGVLVPVSLGTARDNCVVPTPPLAAIIVAFEAAWNRDHRRAASGRQFGADATPMVQDSGLTWLSAETAKMGRPLAYETIRTVRRRLYPTTELRIADAILTALGRQEALYDGTLEVRDRRPGSGCCGRQ